jgi:hypothetical protein
MIEEQIPDPGVKNKLQPKHLTKIADKRKPFSFG